MAQSEEKRFEFSASYVSDKVETEEFKDFTSFAGIPIAQLPANFQATPAELQSGFKNAFSGSRYLTGGDVSGSFYLNKRFAIVADFSVTTNESQRQISNPIFFEDISRARRTRYTVLGGVQWKYRKHRVEPFVRAMAGFVRSNNSVALAFMNQANPSLVDESFRLQDDYTAFAMSFGGGIDIRISKHFALRVIQFDYIPTFPGNRNASLTAPVPGGSGRIDLGLTTLDGGFQNVFRIGVGIVIR